MKPSERFTTYASIDLDAIAANARTLKSHIGESVELYGVVKDDAYGHGAVQSARISLENGATRLAVGRVDEGIQLRRAGLDEPILIMCYTIPDEAGLIVDYDLTATVNTLEGAEAISQAAAGKTATIHIKVDTGMGRYGLLPDEVLGFLKQVTRLPNLDLEGIYTHFATADSADKSYALEQFGIFEQVLETIKSAGYNFRLRHSANSAATLDLPITHLDAVRPGIALYGLYPSAETGRDVPLIPALSLCSHVARLRTLPPGSSISYGRTYTTTTDTPLALVPVGYGDGYQRTLSNNGHVLIKGQIAPIVGRICMDQFVVDVSHIEGVSQDDLVVLIGKQEGKTISTEEIADLADTINYEIVTGVSRRIPRIYMRHGQIQEILRMVAGI